MSWRLFTCNVLLFFSRQTCAECLAGSCAALEIGVCAQKVDAFNFRLNTLQCPAGKFSSEWSECALLAGRRSFSFPTAAEDMSNQGSEQGMEGGRDDPIVQCGFRSYTADSCLCVPRSDAKGVCRPDPSNPEVFDEYWRTCSSNTVMGEAAHRYWEAAFASIALTYSDLPCVNDLQEVAELRRLEQEYERETGSARHGRAGSTGYQECDVSCETCSGSQADNCITCLLNAVLNEGVCTCPEIGFFGPPENCVPCDAGCETCFGSENTDCYTCKTGAKLISYSMPCVCNSGSPDPSLCTECPETTSQGDCASCLPGLYLDYGTCKLCSSTCMTCSDPNSCDSCFPNAVVSWDCVCVDGYFPNPTSAECAECDSSCKTCSNGASACQTCHSNAHVLAYSCVCDDGYYPASTAADCVVCHINCLTCSAPGTSGCVECKPGAELQGTAPSACQCISHTPDPSNCVLCSSACKACLYPATETCTACSPDKVLVAGACFDCPFTCVDCHNADCKSCFSSAALSAISPKRCFCLPGFYPNPDASACTACDESCATCSGAGKSACSTCYVPAELAGTKCVCPGTAFEDPSPRNCSSCDSSCLSCSGSGPTACLSCKAGATLSGAAPNSCKCIDGKYPNPSAGNCTECSPSCYSCAGGGSDMCLKCNAYAKLAGTAPNKCVCMEGLAGSPEKGCIVCHKTCQSCTKETAASCSSCKPGAVLAGSAPNSCKCASGYLPSPDASDCEVCDDTCDPSSSRLPCVAGCVACTGETCLQCGSGMSIQPGVNWCAAGCPVTYFSSNSVCTACISPCVTCTSSLDCTSCDSDHTLTDSRCVRNCPKCFFSANDSLCMPCHGTCESCTGPLSTNCLVCRSGYRMKDGVCVACENCATCDSSGLCLSCAEDMNLTLSGECKTCADCNKPFTATLGNPKPNVFSVTFSRGVSHIFLSVDFCLSTSPPATSLLWTVVNNPSTRLRRLQASLTTLVHISIIEGTWDPDTVFFIAFSNVSILRDEFGQQLPKLSFTSSPPLGQDASPSADGGSNLVDSIVIGAVVGSIFGCCLGTLGIIVYLKRRRRRRGKGTAVKYQEVIAHGSMNVSQ